MLQTLARATGTWVGKNKLMDPMLNIAAESETSATVTPILDGKFFRIDYSWSYQGKPQAGSMLVGLDTNASETTIHWIDTWHMGSKVMELRGPAREEVVTVRGKYSAPPGPDWGWRTQLSLEGDRFVVVMHNVSPDGQEDLAVHAALSRKAEETPKPKKSAVKKSAAKKPAPKPAKKSGKKR